MIGDKEAGRASDLVATLIAIMACALVASGTTACGTDNKDDTSQDKSADAALAEDAKQGGDVAKDQAGGPSDDDCLSCHMDKNRLIATSDPVEEPAGEAADSGET